MVPDPESRAGSSPERKGGKNGQLPPSKIPHPISLIIDPKIFSMALKTCIAILATVGFATAQTSVVSLFIPDTDPQPLAASLVAQVRTPWWRSSNSIKLINVFRAPVPQLIASIALPVLMARIVEWDLECGTPQALRPWNGQ